MCFLDALDHGRGCLFVGSVVIVVVVYFEFCAVVKGQEIAELFVVELDEGAFDRCFVVWVVASKSGEQSVQYSRNDAGGVWKRLGICDIARHCIGLAGAGLTICKYGAIEAGEDLVDLLAIESTVKRVETYFIKHGGNDLIKEHLLICSR